MAQHSPSKRDCMINETEKPEIPKMHLDRKWQSWCVPGIEWWGNKSLWLHRPYYLITRKDIFLLWHSIVGFIYLEFWIFCLTFWNFICKYCIYIIPMVGFEDPCLSPQAVGCTGETPGLLDLKTLQLERKCPFVMPGITSCFFHYQFAAWLGSQTSGNFPLLQSVPKTLIFGTSL